MLVVTQRPLSEVQNDVTKEQLEQYITDLEIGQMEADQVLTDHDIAILELQQKVGA